MPFQSPRFIGDPVLEACLAGQHRMLAGQSGDAVRKVQQALIDLGYSIPDGATGTFGPQTGAAVVHFKTRKGLSPNDPVVGPGTSRALDADIVAFDAGQSVPQPPPTPALASLTAKFLYAGEGATVPGTNFGLGAAIFKFWLCHAGRWRGYTLATNAAVLGYAILESPVVAFSAAEHPVLANLHGSIVDVTINPSTFVKDGGHASFALTVRTNSGVDPRLSFHADGVKGVSAIHGTLSFNATLVELAASEWDPRASQYVPW